MYLILAVFFAFFAYRRLLTYLHIFQQEEYDGGRFLHWLWESKAFDRKISIGALGAGGIALALGQQSINFAAAIILAGVFVAGFLIESDPRKSAKKKLVLTQRAKRILFLASAILVVGVALFALLRPALALWVIPIQLIPLSLPLATMLTAPLESRVQKKYWNEAHEKLLTFKPIVIAVTGSFGKTTLKHILGHVLQTNAQILMTPGSVNTPMGIARVVREQLGPHHRYFICEMGAYGPGSIARLCDLAPPSFGVITAIGPAHYERFKTLDAVARTKFELAEAVLASQGKIVVNSDVLSFEFPKTLFAKHSESFVSVGDHDSDVVRLVDHQSTPQGIVVTLESDGERFEVTAPVFGDHQASNIALAFAAGRVMGMAPDQITRALASTPQTPHRLEVKRQADGVIIIDDAYNSNPVGFASGLRTLTTLCTSENGRRILVTPGMVELGEAHDEEHRKIGELAATQVDIMLAIQGERIPTLVEGFLNEKSDDALIRCNSFADADQWIRQNARPGDVILIENDLPDLYERKLRL